VASPVIARAAGGQNHQAEKGVNNMNVLINITWQGQSGNYLVNMDTGVDDNTIKNVCEEAVRSGEVPGISPNIPKNAFANFVIDRFHDGQTRFVVRPKVPFG
jgi:hypothetical protein